MTKKDYELIASVFHRYSGFKEPRDKVLAEALAYEFEKDNPKFDRDKFLAACGIEKTCTICDKSISVGDVHPECANDYVKNFYK